MSPLCYCCRCQRAWVKTIAIAKVRKKIDLCKYQEIILPKYSKESENFNENEENGLDWCAILENLDNLDGA